MQDVQTQSRFWDSASRDASPAETEVQHLISALLKPDDWVNRVVLDAGCGNGDYSASFVKGGARRVVGMDVSAGSLHTARAKVPVAPLYQASLSELPFPTGSFDVIWSWGVLHYVPDSQAALREIGRVLTPGGVAVIHTLGANVWSGVELSLQRVFSRSPRPVQSLVLEIGSAAIPLVTRLRTGKHPQAHTSKSVRQKLQERLLVPGHQQTFSLSDLQKGFGTGFSVTQAHPPVADLLGRDMSLTVLVRKSL